MSFARTLPARILACIAGGLLLLALYLPVEAIPVPVDCAPSRLEAVKGLGVSLVAVRSQGQVPHSAPIFTRTWDPAVAFSENPNTQVPTLCTIAFLPTVSREVPDRSPSLVGVVELRI